MQHECKVMAIANQKGGVGKTTTAAALGAGLARKGYKTLLIDLDAQANLTMSLGFQTPDDLPVTIANLMGMVINDEPVKIEPFVLSHDSGVKLIPANIQLSALDATLVNTMSRESILRTCINDLRPLYDYILIDCTPSLGMLTINALAAADQNGSISFHPSRTHPIYRLGYPLERRRRGSLRGTQESPRECIACARVALLRFQPVSSGTPTPTKEESTPCAEKP